MAKLNEMVLVLSTGSLDEVRFCAISILSFILEIMLNPPLTNLWLKYSVGICISHCQIYRYLSMFNVEHNNETWLYGRVLRQIENKICNVGFTCDMRKAESSYYCTVISQIFQIVPKKTVY